MVFEGHILICLGFLAKSWSADKCDRGEDNWATSFHEVIFAIAKTESQISYTRVIDAFAKAMKICCGVDDALERVGQFHVDLSAAAAAMHQSVLPHALLALDWAHFVGAVRPKVHASQAGLEPWS